EAVEGGAFALLAHERLRGRPGNLPATTGARNAVLCGQVVDGTYRGRAVRTSNGRAGVPGPRRRSGGPRGSGWGSFEWRA
ncbi:MAG: anhydro-N-acetylmuramic acid kinase, partial [Planctomycetota bacterium]|nr:anhydro-N-acetylmuramic acid kinase [Planctomycetota bacterium]